MLQPLINRFNSLRKQKYFNQSLFKSTKQYACIGVGMHSLANIYPILHHFGINVKYICTRSSAWDSQMQRTFPSTQFIHSIDDIIDDKEIEGVFVCATPSAHFEILKKLLSAGKKIFVEKPPCQHLSELKDLIEISTTMVCKVGLQRRYWPGNKYLLKKLSAAKSYQYSFHFGKYIQGNVFTDLFIHSLDYCSFLFGNYKILSFTKHKDDTGTTVQLHVSHSNGVSGLIELSTQFSWNSPSDIITINCQSESIVVQYPLKIKGDQKPKHFLNIPAERLINQPLIIKEYFSATNLIIPAPELNTLVLQGFYNEVKTFIEIVEGQVSKNILQNDLPGMMPTFEIIEQLQASK
jgi:virulence factor